MYDLFRKHFNKYVTLTETEYETSESFFEFRKYKKHQFVLQEGDVCRHEYFILKGCTRSYETDDKGQEHIIQFGVEDWWVGDMYSFLTGTPSKVNIDCVEEVEILSISVSNHEKLCEAVPKLERHFRKLVQHAYCASVSRLYSNLSKTAAERYTEFIAKYPQIDQRVPNHYIASYLGITPPSLSRIRSQLASASKSQ